MFKTWKSFGILAVLVLVFVLAACGASDEGEDTTGDEGNEEEATDDTAAVGEGKEIELVYVNWDTEIASTHVVGKVLEDLGYDVKRTSIENAAMWEAVANGEADGMVAAWLPATHEAQYEEFGDQVVELGPNLEGAKIGLVVPSYMDVDSIADLTDEVDQTITGIEAGAGVVASAESALEDYDNLSDWSIQTSSSGAMTTQLGEAIDNEENIIVTGWSPHWKFSEYDLKYLEDPEGSFGDAETIETMVREGLEEDMPNAYKVLDQFEWTQEDSNSVMVDLVVNGVDAEEAAATWVEDNQEKVAEWTEGVE
ncbi:glycine betaine/proline transport system substrate-binding protein [Gracilibacillus orientalis]|uniref:Glycine betaine/proline transport system substrate-binding protein n=1 Tax=Gracilibacillus orientalis TaxID=334253 RepID=A0A1I4IS19_9BACI|nr:glycine betaine ABC transporter substrate-binding protein [Gracilibacillus orientalis]SFL57159.1 glycine betaine/proline transport system substrate-binding protein [Gracilibacillus orientalis]